MKKMHATDSELQRFIFDHRECAPQIIKHIDSCKECTRRVVIYESLANDIRNLPEPKLEYSLEEVVLDRITSGQVVTPNFNYIGSFTQVLIAGLFILALIVFRETFSLLVSDTISYHNYFIIFIFIFISFALLIDTIRNFNRKMSMMN